MLYLGIITSSLLDILVVRWVLGACWGMPANCFLGWECLHPDTYIYLKPSYRRRRRHVVCFSDNWPMDIRKYQWKMATSCLRLRWAYLMRWTSDSIQTSYTILNSFILQGKRLVSFSHFSIKIHICLIHTLNTLHRTLLYWAVIRVRFRGNLFMVRRNRKNQKTNKGIPYPKYYLVYMYCHRIHLDLRPPSHISRPDHLTANNM